MSISDSRRAEARRLHQHAATGVDQLDELVGVLLRIVAVDRELVQVQAHAGLIDGRRQLGAGQRPQLRVEVAPQERAGAEIDGQVGHGQHQPERQHPAQRQARPERQRHGRSPPARAFSM